jgi:hypothetical protein
MTAPCTGLTHSGAPCKNKGTHDGVCAFHAVNQVPADRTCPTCRMRWHVKTSREVTANPPHPMTPTMYTWMENLARFFDAEAPELFTAEEFMQWAKLDLLGRASPIHSQKANAGHNQDVAA